MASLTWDNLMASAALRAESRRAPITTSALTAQATTPVHQTESLNRFETLNQFCVSQTSRKDPNIFQFE